MTCPATCGTTRDFPSRSGEGRCRVQPYPYPAFLWGARQVPPNFASAASAGYPDASNMPSVSGSTLTYYPNYPSNLASATQSLTPQSGELPLTTPGATIEWPMP